MYMYIHVYIPNTAFFLDTLYRELTLFTFFSFLAAVAHQ